jgi:hypothetical protein
VGSTEAESVLRTAMMHLDAVLDRLSSISEQEMTSGTHFRAQKFGTF